MTFLLRDYQQEAVDRTIVDLSLNDKVALILPTGAGKTEVFINICQRWLETKQDESILVLSHLSILTDQTMARFRSRAPNVRTGVLQANARPHPMTEVVIGTMQTTRKEARSRFLEDRLNKKIGLIIIDEAHYIQTDSYLKVLDYFPNAKCLGVTATPFRENKIMTNFFNKVSFSLSLRNLIEKKYLVPPKLYQMVRESNDTVDIIAQVVATYKNKEMGKHAIIFMKTKADARLIRNVLIESGVTAEAITSDTGEDTRNEYFKKFDSGEIKVLTSVDVLTAGFDAPAIQAIFMPYPVNSATRYIQRIGRGLRPHESSGKKDCRVYVYGGAPSISRKLYEKIQNIALNQGGAIKEYDHLTDQFEFNDWAGDEEIYQWNKDCVECINKMKKLEMYNFAEQLDLKEFPAKFLNNITDIINRLPNNKSSLPHGHKPATPAQLNVLKNNGFQSCSSINKAEASIMISAIFGKVKESRPDMIDSGKHAGKHISELPFAYRSYVLKNMPESSIARKINNWNRRRRA